MSSMEGNKDESDRCIQIAKSLINNGERGRAIKFLNKAERLYPTQTAKDLLELLSKLNGTAHRSAGAGNDNVQAQAEANNVRRRRKAREGASEARRSQPASGSDSDPVSDRDASAPLLYTREQSIAVTKIKQCKDYYEILSVEKTCEDGELKKAYRRLALQFHPDKNQAPGAGEAFKMIGNAFAVLSDSEKRRKYDMFGHDDDDSHLRSRRDDVSHGFEADISPDELFNMFFGGGMPTTHVYRRGGFTTRVHYANRARRAQNHTHDESGYSVFLQLLPLILLITLSMLSSLLVREPLYSLERNSRYAYDRQTRNLNVAYYVKHDFEREFTGNLHRLERQIEDDYVSDLRTRCMRERTYKEALLRQARAYGDRGLYERAMEMQTSSCDRLQQLYS